MAWNNDVSKVFSVWIFSICRTDRDFFFAGITLISQRDKLKTECERLMVWSSVLKFIDNLGFKDLSENASQPQLWSQVIFLCNFLLYQWSQQNHIRDDNLKPLINTEISLQKLFPPKFQLQVTALLRLFKILQFLMIVFNIYSLIIYEALSQTQTRHWHVDTDNNLSKWQNWI